MLAECGQLMAAEWAAIRRGLAIGRPAHRPPGRQRKTPGHRTILAPSGGPSSRAASLAGALALLGVGVVLAKAGRERRTLARARVPRSPWLLIGEPPAAGLRRVVLGQLDLAIELLEGPLREGGAQTVHETRKSIKRLRALMRLLRPALGSKRFTRENSALRECGRRLSGARDAEVMVATLDAILERHPGLTRSAGASASVSSLRGELLAEREWGPGGPPAGARTQAEQLRAVAGELRAIRARVLEWELPERPADPAALSTPGLERIYRTGRRRRRRALWRRDLASMHEWRKSAKDLRYAAEALDRRLPAEKPDGKTGKSKSAQRLRTGKKGKSARRLRRVARRAERLGELLGEEHDLALLARLIRRRRKHFEGQKRTRKRLLKRIARRRRDLRRRALREGKRLYRRKPSAFVRRLRKAL